MDADVAGAGDERGLVEDAVRLLLAQLPTGWRCLHAEVEPAALPVIALATATGGAGESHPVEVPPRVIDLLAEHQRRAASTGESWRRMIIDCDSDRTLSVRTEPVVSVTGSRRPRRWPVPVLAAVTLGCFGAAAVVYVTGRAEDPPPRAGLIPLPPRPARQQEAADVIARWVDAENHADVATMRELACAEPAPSVQRWFASLQEFGQRQGLVFPDAVTEFRDEGSRVWVTVAVRVRPLNETQQQEVQAVQEEGGFFDDNFTLGDEGGALKVCDVSMARS